ncbi:MAG: SURF1 family protein [Casimicrobiaceae bacterium]
MALIVMNRRFQPRVWAILLVCAVVLLTVRLGNWQGDRAAYKLAQQAQITEAQQMSALSPYQAAEARLEARYRSVRGRGRFLSEPIWFVDNRIHEGRAGYAVLQLFEPEPIIEATPGGASRLILVDRGWVPVGADRAVLPKIETPTGVVTIAGRLNLPPSRNPGTRDNTDGQRLNYISTEELSRQAGVPLGPLLVELTEGEAWLGTTPPAPMARINHHYAYQVQWYSMAVLALVLFFVFSFRKVEATPK